MPDRYGDPLDDEPAAQDEPPDDLWAAEHRAQAVVNCGLCDDDGYRGPVVCDHEEHSTPQGRARARALFEAAKAKREAK